MKRMYKTSAQFKTWLLTTLLGALGFQSCDLIPRVEYGMPHADHTLKGTVTNLQGTAIPGIRVVVNPDGNAPSDTLLTDAKGAYLFQDSFSLPNKKYRVVFEDVDGTQNGGPYIAKRDSVTFGDYKGGSGWYQGEQTITLNETLETE